MADIIDRVRRSPYIPGEPNAKQWAFLLEARNEVMFGGAAGPGKSWALLAAALLYADEPRYRALLLRRTYADLRQPGSLMDMADEWLSHTDAVRKDNGREWWFPSGARLVFGYLANENHKLRYQSAAFHFVGFDELTQFTNTQYRYLFSRVRRKKGDRSTDIPLRVRSASNPGGPGHEWVKADFIDGMQDPLIHAQRLFIPAKMEDNPHLDRESYLLNLARLDPVTRRQLEHGDWGVRPAGNFFLMDRAPVVTTQDSVADWSTTRVLRCRAWDLAASETGDWAVGVRVARDAVSGRWAVEDVARVRAEPDSLFKVLRATAEADGPDLPQVIEEEGGSGGKISMKALREGPFFGHPVYPVKPTNSKLNRAMHPASLVAAGSVELRPGAWVPEFRDELGAFPEVNHDDQVDAFSHAVNWISRFTNVVGPSVPKGNVDALAARPKRAKQSQVRVR
jgi:predicted phage terminase large subunit-like protein